MRYYQLFEASYDGMALDDVPKQFRSDLNLSEEDLDRYTMEKEKSLEL